MMAHSLARATTTPFSTTSNSDVKRIAPFPPSSVIVRASRQAPNAAPSHDDNKIVNRRTLSLGLLGSSLIGLNGGEPSARAAGRRPPPPQTEERKDPNVSGLQVKVLASKKRKEAMKEEIAKLRQKGKNIQMSPQEAPPQEAPQIDR